jgi:hypothetical protein
MATKTFKIGEYCVGGIIKVDINKNEVIANILDYNTKKPIAFGKCTVTTDSNNGRRNLREFLEDHTTHYYACKVIEWVETKVKFNTNSW